MLINGIDQTLDPWHDAERKQIIDALRDHLRRQPAFVADHAGAALAASAAVDYLFDELAHAAAYIWLRTEICKTMPDPDAWDGDETEEGVLARYVQHQALASHGDCDGCGRRVAAGERFEAAGNVGNWVPEGSPDTHAVICGDCA
jgi:hypothetical protein